MEEYCDVVMPDTYAPSIGYLVIVAVPAALIVHFTHVMYFTNFFTILQRFTYIPL